MSDGIPMAPRGGPVPTGGLVDGAGLVSGWVDRKLALPPYAPVVVPCDDVSAWAADANQAVSDEADYRVVSTQPKAMRIQRLANAWGSLNVDYTFGSPVDLRNTHWMMTIQLIEGAGFADPAEFTPIVVQVFENANWNKFRMFGSPGGGYWNGGDYETFGGPIDGFYTQSGAPPDLSAVTSIRITTSVDNPGDSVPALQITDVRFVPQPSFGELLLQFDGAYDNHYNAAAYLNKYGMRGTFYVSEATTGGSRLTVAQLQEMQHMGHLIALYADEFRAETTIAAKIAKVQANQRWMWDNGFHEGSRHLVVGGSSTASDGYSTEIRDALIPKYLDTITFIHADADDGSTWGTITPFVPHRVERYHEFNTAKQVAIEARFDVAAAGGGRFGVLLHDIDPDNDMSSGDWDEFVDFIDNTVVADVANGKMKVTTVAEAHQRSLDLVKPSIRAQEAGLTISAANAGTPDGTAIVSIQLKNPDGSDLAQRGNVRVWTSGRGGADFGVPVALANNTSFSTGAIVDPHIADGDYTILTDANGVIVSVWDDDNDATLYFMAEYNGRVYSASVAVTGT